MLKFLLINAKFSWAEEFIQRVKSDQQNTAEGIRLKKDVLVLSGSVVHVGKFETVSDAQISRCLIQQLHKVNCNQNHSSQP